MPPCIDVYSLSTQRNPETIQRFLQSYVNVADALKLVDVSVAPVELDEQLPIDQWEILPIPTLEDAVALGLSSPHRGFLVYLRAQAPWCGAMLSFARTGEITFGVSVDDPLGRRKPQRIAKRLLRRLCNETGGVRGWAVHEMPLSVDPQIDKPWDGKANVAEFVR